MTKTDVASVVCRALTLFDATAGFRSKPDIAGNRVHDAVWNLWFRQLQLERYLKKYIVRTGLAEFGGAG